VVLVAAVTAAAKVARRKLVGKWMHERIRMQVGKSGFE
jgi:hypothetical protein